MVVNTPTKIFWGKDELKILVKEFKNDKVLIVTGKSQRVLKTDVFKTLKNLFESNDIQYVIYSNVTTNPTKEQVDLGVDVCKENKCTAIIGFGGGSVIDVSKAICFSSINNDFWNYVESPHPDERSIKVIDYKYFCRNRK